MVAFQAELLQPQLLARMQRVIAQGELAHAYLLVGPSGSGKLALAQWLTMRLFCEHVVAGQPDGTCPECQRILSGNHPDVVIAQAEGRQIKVDQVRHLKAEFTKTGMEGQTKVFIIEAAEKLTVSAANSLLKFIEEPGPGIYILLLTTNKNAVLPTIQSRTQVLELLPLSTEAVQANLQAAGVPPYLQPVMLGLTTDAQLAQAWLADDWFQKAVAAVWQWFKAVSQGQAMAFVQVATDLVPLVNERQQAQVLLDLMTLLWRDALLVKNGVQAGLHFQQWAAELTTQSQALPAARVLAASELTLECRKLLDQNLNFQTVAEQLTLRQLAVIKPEGGR